MKKLSVIILSFLLVPIFAFAHPGRTDSSGCHICRTNCPNWGLSYGEYHCHRSKGIIQPKEPVRSIHNNSGNGITVPAPEYKTPSNTLKKVENTKVINKADANI